MAPQASSSQYINRFEFLSQRYPEYKNRIEIFQDFVIKQVRNENLKSDILYTFSQTNPF